jgi:lysozyme
MSMYTGILDVSHWEYDRLGARGIRKALTIAKAAGIGLVIAKASQGKDYVDPSFNAWVNAIVDAGLMLGAYHFGSNTAAGAVEADWFLKALSQYRRDERNLPDHMMLCLDWEKDPKKASRTMALDQAREFLNRVESTMGRRAVLYSGSSFLCDHVRGNDPIGRFPLWVAAYGPTHPKIPRAWSEYALFQYTDGVYGPADQARYPRKTLGFGKDGRPGGCDRSLFNGTLEQLRTRLVEA